MKPLFYYRLMGKIKNIGAEWDDLAPTHKTAIKYAHRNINPTPPKHIGNTTAWSNEYCLASSGSSISDRFRHDTQEPIDLAISETVATYKTKIPLVLYRGVTNENYNNMVRDAKEMKGIDLYEKGFLSTSILKGHEIAYKPVDGKRLRIYIPSGTQALYLGNVFSNEEEQRYYEVAVQRGAKLRILSIDDTYINCILKGFQ